jgi:hypothetical protein
MNLGVLAAQAGDLPAAFRLLLRAVRLDAADPHPLVNAGEPLLVSVKPDETSATMERNLILLMPDPHHPGSGDGPRSVQVAYRSAMALKPTGCVQDAEKRLIEAEILARQHELESSQ